ncbi:MAG: hypothetical protein U1E76_15455 [Planctomycetota bacterium]
MTWPHHRGAPSSIHPALISTNAAARSIRSTTRLRSIWAGVYREGARVAVGEHAGSLDSDDLNDLDQRHVRPVRGRAPEVGRKAIADEGQQEDFTVLVGGLTGGTLLRDVLEPEADREAVRSRSTKEYLEVVFLE